jgi:hypothetical protein
MRKLSGLISRWMKDLAWMYSMLIGEQEDGLQRELAVAEVEEIFQRGTKQIEDHGVVVALGTEPAHERDTNTAGKGLVDASLILELGVLGLDALELDSNLLTRDDVSACARLAQVRGQGVASHVPR